MGEYLALNQEVVGSIPTEFTFFMKRKHRLANGGWALFDFDKDVQSLQPNYDNTYVLLNNGTSYLLEGRSHGV